MSNLVSVVAFSMNGADVRPNFHREEEARKMRIHLVSGGK